MINTSKVIVTGAAFIGCLTASSAALAQFEIGGRVGYAIPMGEALDGSDLSDGISGAIPLTLDIGYRVIEPLFVGAYLGYGFGMIGDEDELCELDGVDCSVSTFDLGVQAQYHFDPGSGMDVWAGGGLGYESLSTSIEGSGAEISGTFSALPQIMLQAGLDFGDEKMGYGPFLRFTHATYSSVSADCSGDATCVDGDEDIPDDAQAGHQWLTIGVRGTFLL